MFIGYIYPEIKDIIEKSGAKIEVRFSEGGGEVSQATGKYKEAFEKEFDMEIPDEDTEHLITVGDVKKYIEEYS